LFTLLLWPVEAKTPRIKPMNAADQVLTLSRDPRFAPYAVSALAAWLWTPDATRVLWTNATGAALLGVDTPAALAEQTFDHENPVAAEVARLAPSLAGWPRQEKLRAIAPTFTGNCSRVSLPEGGHGILIISTDPAKPALPLAERVERLFAQGSDAVAVFNAEGALVYATGELGADTTLSTLGADALKTQAIASGSATGTSEIGTLTLTRLGSGLSTVLVASIPDLGAETPEAEAPAAESPVVETTTNIAPEVEPTSEIAEQPQAPDVNAAESASLETSTEIETPPVSDETPAAPETPTTPERRVPLRFVWTMDADEHFMLAAPAFADAMGPRTAAVIGKPWAEIASALALDPQGRVAKAIASRDTWSGVTIAWPTETDGETATVELSGLPVFDRDRTFHGYRGFGLCRDAPRTTAAPEATTVETPLESKAPAQVTAGETPTAETSADPRPLLTVVPASKNVVPFRGTPPATPEKRPTLTPVERTAFHELGEVLAKNGNGIAPPIAPATPETSTPQDEAPAASGPPAMPSAFARHDSGTKSPNTDQLVVLERLPVAVLIHRADTLLYANRTFLEWTGYTDLAAVTAAGGLERLVVEPGTGPLDKQNGTGKTFTVATRSGATFTCEGRLYTVPWQDENALMFVLMRSASDDRLKASEQALRASDAETRELKSILDTATDGVIVVDREGLVLGLNRSAEALFGYEYHEMARRPFGELFAPESERAARDYLDGLTRNGVASVLNDGREVIGRVRQGGLIPLFMTMGRVGDSGEKFCAVLRDITQWKRAEEDLLNAKRTAERASSAKSDFLAKISHEIRTPLNAIIGFSEVMMQQQFGPIGNERYAEYLKDIHSSGEHLVSLINDLLDLSKIEAGKLDLVFASVNLNTLVQQCVALMQPQANQQRIIIRSSLSTTLPPVVADARSVRQIVLNLLSNSIKFTGAGGQVIVSTALTDRAEAVLRVRDTGIGMTDKEIETAMEPFRQLATSTRWGSGGTGLGLPLTKALAEANRAAFSIKSATNAGTLVEITFPGTRVLAE
jgi:PAS domain S-box-containing protein